MDLSAWAHQRARYSRARRGRFERGATVGECAMVAAVAQAMALRASGWKAADTGAGTAGAPDGHAAPVADRSVAAA